MKFGRIWKPLGDLFIKFRRGGGLALKSFIEHFGAFAAM